MRPKIVNHATLKRRTGKAGPDQEEGRHGLSKGRKFLNCIADPGLAVTLPELLNSVATKFPDKLALTAPGRTGLSYRALAAHIDCAQAALNELGLGRGDRI